MRLVYRLEELGGEATEWVELVLDEDHWKVVET